MTRTAHAANETAAPRMQSLVRKSAMLHANYTKISGDTGGVYFVSATTSSQREVGDSSRRVMRRV